MMIRLVMTLLLLGFLAPTVWAAPLSRFVLHIEREDFLGAADGLYWTGDGWAWDDLGLRRGLGFYTSPPIEAQFPFNDLVPSWSAITPEGSRITVQMRTGDGQVWTGWYTIATWGGLRMGAGSQQRDAQGRVDADTLVLNQHHTHFQYRITLLDLGGKESPVLRAFTVVYADTRKQAPRQPLALPASGVAPWARDLPVPFRSQMVEHPSIANRICAPTSLAMVLEYHGLVIPTAQVAQAVYDTNSQIYGNWPLNAAVAAEHGLTGLVVRFPDFEGVQDEIARGNPVILSISFGPGELRNSPINSTAGHLIVVRGFTPEGNVIVNDPAALDEARGIVVYDRDQLMRAWSNGVAILVRP